MKKLIAAACIEKTKSPDNAKDVLFHATSKGKSAIRGHGAFQERTFRPLQGIEARLSPADTETISRFLTDLNEELRRK